MMNLTRVSANFNGFIHIIKSHEVRGVFKSVAFNGVVTLAALVQFHPNHLHVTTVLDGFSDDPILGRQEVTYNSYNSPHAGLVPAWKINQHLELERIVAQKQDVVQVLQTLGVDKEKLDILKSVKITEFQDYVDAAGLSRDDDKKFSVTLKSKQFKAGIEASHPLVKVVMIRAVKDQYNGGLRYSISAPWAEQLKNLEKQADAELAKLRLPIYSGNLS